MTQTLDEAGEHTGALTRARRRRRLPAPAWIVLALVLVIVVGWLLAFSPLLGARSVQVSGEQQLSAEQIRSVAAVPHGTPLARLDTAAVAARVQTLPDIAHASVQVSYPGTVVIRVSERQAVGVTPLSSTLFGLVDGTGRQFRTDRVRPHGLPLLVPMAGSADPAATLAALAAVGHSLPATLVGEVGEITATGPDAVTLVMTNSWTVFWGDARRNTDKAKVLPMLLKRGGTHFDVSNPDLVFSH